MRLFIGALLSIFAACGGTSTTSSCDTAAISLVCSIPSAGQCVEYTGLSTADSKNVTNFCNSNSGAVGTAACTASGRVGTCTIPPTTPNTEINCSPNGTVTIRYYPPRYQTASDAQSICSTVSGSAFTPN